MFFFLILRFIFGILVWKNCNNLKLNSNFYILKELNSLLCSTKTQKSNTEINSILWLKALIMIPTSSYVALIDNLTWLLNSTWTFNDIFLQWNFYVYWKMSRQKISHIEKKTHFRIYPASFSGIGLKNPQRKIPLDKKPSTKNPAMEKWSISGFNFVTQKLKS